MTPTQEEICLRQSPELLELGKHQLNSQTKSILQSIRTIKQN